MAKVAVKSRTPAGSTRTTRTVTMIRLSVVIPFWNAAKWLRTPIDSVLGQDYPAEIIAVDDGSTDGSLAVARSYGSRVTVIEKQNGGVSTARNAGLAAASGDYVIFLDADDYLEGPLLRGVADVAAGGRPDLILSPGAAELPHRRYVHPHTPLWRAKDNLGIAADVANGLTTPVNAQAWRRDYLLGIGGYRADALLREDSELLLRALVGGATLGFNSEGLAMWVLRPGVESKSRRLDLASLASAHAWHRDHVALTPRGYAELWDAYGRRSYSWAGLAFEQGYGELGRAALALARECGLAGHPGSSAHRIAATLLGLEGKIRIARGWRTIRRILGIPKRAPRRRSAPAKT